MPQRLTESSRVVGAKQTLKAIQNGQIEVVYLARDADEHVTSPVLQVCVEQGIDVIEIDSMAELGKACSIQVGAAVAGVVKSKSD